MRVAGFACAAVALRSGRGRTGLGHRVSRSAALAVTRTGLRGIQPWHYRAGFHLKADTSALKFLALGPRSIAGPSLRFGAAWQPHRWDIVAGQAGYLARFVRRTAGHWQVGRSAPSDMSRPIYCPAPASNGHHKPP